MKPEPYQGYLVEYLNGIEFWIVLNTVGYEYLDILKLPIDNDEYLNSQIDMLSATNKTSSLKYNEWRYLKKLLITSDVRYFRTPHLSFINTFFGMQGSSELAFDTTPQEHLKNLMQFNKLTTEGGRWLPVDENSMWANNLPICHPQRRKKAYFQPLQASLISPKESDDLQTLIYSTNIGLILSTSNVAGHFKVQITDAHISEPIINIGWLLSSEDYASMGPGIPIAGLKKQFEYINARAGLFLQGLIPIKVKPSERHILPVWHPQCHNRYMQLSEIKVGNFYVEGNKVKKLVDVKENPYTDTTSLLETDEKAYKKVMFVELETVVDGKPQLEAMNLHYFRLNYTLSIKDTPQQDTANPISVLLADKKLKDKTYSKDKHIPEKPKTIIEWNML